MTIHEPFITRCYELAEQAVAAGNHPFAALIVVDGKVMSEALNTVVTEADVTCHAELNLIRSAFQQLPPEVLKTATLYSSTEPCPMCAGAIYWSGISRLVFGVSGADLGEIAGEAFVWSSAEILERGNRRIEVIGPIAAGTGRKLHQSFWI